MNLKGNTIPWILATVTGITMYLQYYLDFAPIGALAEGIKTTAIIISAGALGVGMINLVQTHITNITRPKKRQPKNQKVLSGYWLILCVFTTLTGLIPPFTTHPWHTFMTTYIYTNAQFAAQALFTPFILIAAWRAFKIRDVASGVFTIAAVLVALGNVPIGGLIWSGFPVISTWINQKALSSVFRAIIIGAAVGMVSLALRVYLRMDAGLYRVES